jgi:hypothetical protein
MSGKIRLFDTWTEEQKEEALATMIEIAQRGGHQSEMCLALGIKSEDTFYRWKREIPEFKEMCDTAALHSKTFYENIGLNGTLGRIPNFSATTYAIIVNNKFRDEYKPANQDGNSVNNTTINVLNLSSSELDYKIQQKLEVLRRFGEDIKIIEHDKDV